MTSPPSPHAEVVVDLGAIRHNVRRLRELVTEDGSTGPQLMVVVKADAYGHGMLPVARAARAAGAEWLGVSTGDEALALRRAGDTGRLLCWLAAPGADYRDLIDSDVDVTTYSVRQLEEIVDSARAGRTGRSRADQVRHRPVPGWCPALGVAVAGGGRAHRRAGGQHPGDRALVPPRLLRRAGAPGQRRADGRVRRGAGAGRPGWARPRGAAPGQLGGRDPAPRRPARPGAAGHRGLRAQPGARRALVRGPGAGAGDDGARVRRTHQGAARPARASPTGTPTRRACRRGWRWCRWGTATASRGMPPRRPRCWSRGSADACSAGSAWTSSSSRPAPAQRRRRGRAVRARGPAASRRRPTGPVERHDRLRDRHPDGRPADPALGRSPDEHPTQSLASSMGTP